MHGPLIWQLHVQDFFSPWRQATNFIESGKYKKVIVVGADKMSSIVDYTDRTTCPLFGDAAACVLLEPSIDEERH